jgi:hypothetical protein
MIDVYNNAGTESYGCFKHLKAAKPTLERLGEAGVQSVTVSSFRGRNLMRVYRVLINEGCRIIKMPILPPSLTPAA